MLRFLFPRLTDRPTAGSALFEKIVGETRQRHWYLKGQVPDSVDGRFAVLATILALATVRLESGAESARTTSVALTERFIEAMDAEHRQLGVSDPALGRKVRKLVSGVSRRVDEWRAAVSGKRDWADTAAASIFGESRVAPPAGLAHCSEQLRAYWIRLEATADAALAEGAIR